MISAGFQLNHTWFKSERVFDRLPEFKNKKLILDKMIELENLCEDLTYGSPKSVAKIKESIELFKELENLINKLRGKNG